MTYTKRELRIIYDRTVRRCHVCRKSLSFVNYGKLQGRTPWEVDHSVARARGGTNRLSNLLPACPECNRSKGSSNNQAVRRAYGHARKPLSKAARASARRWNTAGGGAIGAAVGAIIAGPPGALICGSIAAALAHEVDPG